jgi:hypothetical protein
MREFKAVVGLIGLRNSLVLESIQLLHSESRLDSHSIVLVIVMSVWAIHVRGWPTKLGQLAENVLWSRHSLILACY